MNASLPPSKSIAAATVLACVSSLMGVNSAAADDGPAIRIEAPSRVLSGVPVEAVLIEVRTDDGQRDGGLNGPAQVSGVEIVDSDDGAEPVPLTWDRGLLKVETNRGAGRKVFITDDVIHVTTPDGRAARQRVQRLPGWFSLLPALVAVGGAVVLRETLVALFAAVWTGMLLLGDSTTGWVSWIGGSLIETIDEAFVGQLVPSNGDATHVQIILFTLFLGSLIGVMSASGGTDALVRRLTPVTRSRRGGQITTWFLGLVVFFDDYANSLLLGSTMRPVTDRLRISREKLAFLVDATAAPIAGLALVSTWVGFEVGLIGDSFARLAETNPQIVYSGDAYGTFLATWPYRFYPILLLVFVLAIAWTGRDFGPMWRAERRTLEGGVEGAGSAKKLFPNPFWVAGAGPTGSPGTAIAGVSQKARAPATPFVGGFETASKPQARGDAGESNVGNTGSPPTGTMWNAIVPLGVLVGGIVLGFWITGRAGVGTESPSLWQVIGNADSNRVLLASSFLASVVAGLMAIATRSLSLRAAVDAWLDGAKSMVLGAAVLILAWAVAMVCDADHLNTAGYLVEITTGRLGMAWMPAVAFVLSAAISFATGSSWATMGLLIPLVVSVTFGLMTGEMSLTSELAIDRHPLMLASVGSVLAGSIFGDHCSPISDTTVLSSVASDCDHLAHVMTQLPYAVSVGLVALIAGCLPAGFGVPWIVCLPVGIVAIALIVRLAGRPTVLDSDSRAVTRVSSELK